MKKRILMVGAVFFGGMVGCQKPNSNQYSVVHHYTLKQKCPTLLVMKVGERLRFRAIENPATGYHWVLSHPLNLFSTEQSFISPENEDEIVGQEGEKTFYFKAEKPGQELIELLHQRSWEENEPPIQRWQCRIRVA
jgi:inhibitor of cysteine peptidase